MWSHSLRQNLLNQEKGVAKISPCYCAVWIDGSRLSENAKFYWELSSAAGPQQELKQSSSKDPHTGLVCI